MHDDLIKYINLLSDIIEDMATTLKECAKIVGIEITEEDIIQYYQARFKDTTAMEDYLLKKGKITIENLQEDRENYFAKNLIFQLKELYTNQLGGNNNDT